MLRSENRNTSKTAGLWESRVSDSSNKVNNMSNIIWKIFAGRSRRKPPRRKFTSCAYGVVSGLPWGFIKAKKGTREYVYMYIIFSYKWKHHEENNWEGLLLSFRLFFMVAFFLNMIYICFSLYHQVVVFQ